MLFVFAAFVMLAGGRRRGAGPPSFSKGQEIVCWRGAVIARARSMRCRTKGDIFRLSVLLPRARYEESINTAVMISNRSPAFCDDTNNNLQTRNQRTYFSSDVKKKSTSLTDDF